MRYVCLILLILPISSFASAIYKCTDHAGRVEFTNQRCATDTVQKEVPRAAPAPLRDDEAMSVSEFGARLKYSWWKKGQSLMEANFVVYNDNGFGIRDIEVECVHFANSGTQIDRNVRTIYEVIPALSRKGVSGFSMGFIHSQAERSTCSIISVKK